MFHMILMMNNDLSLNIINRLAFVMDTQCFFCDEWTEILNINHMDFRFEEEWTEILNINHMDFRFEEFHFPVLRQVVVNNCYSAVQEIPCCSLAILPHYVVVFSASPFHITLSLTSNLTMFSHT